MLLNRSICYASPFFDWKGGDPAAVSDKDRKRLACLLLRLEHIKKANVATLMDRIAPYWLSQGFFLDQIGHRN